MNMVIQLVRRDLAREWRSGSWWLPVSFFLLVATLFPFAVGPDAQLLAKTGGGILWVAALLAALMPMERLFAPDAQSGVLDQMAMRGLADESIAAAKLVAHMIGFGVPLLLALFPAAALLNLSAIMLQRLAIGLMIATPALAGLAVMVSAMTLGQSGNRSGSTSALGGLLMLPLAIPVLIFGAGMLDPLGHSALLFLAASSLLLVAITPFAAGAALRLARQA